jgi:hypothetical protein
MSAAGRRRGRRTGLIGLLLASLIAGCGGPDVSHYQSLLEKLAIPADWQLVHTTVQRPGGSDHRVDPSRSADDIDCSRLAVSCPTVIRSYLVPGTPTELLPVAQKLLTDAGYSIDQVIQPKCEGTPSGPACSVMSIEGTDRLSINLYNPGEDIQGLGVARPDRSIVIVAAELKK